MAQQTPVLVVLVAIGLLAMVFGYKQIGLLAVNLAVAFTTYVRSSSKTVPQPTIADKPATVKAQENSAGWKVTLVRAEIVRDEPWSGESRCLSPCDSLHKYSNLSSDNL